MSDNYLLIIASAVIGAIAVTFYPVVLCLFKRPVKRTNPFMMAFVDYPCTVAMFYAGIYVAYVMYFNHHP